LRRAWLAIVIGGCHAPAAASPIAPLALPEAPVAIEDGSRWFAAPSRGDVRWDGARVNVHYDAGAARLQVSAIRLGARELERSEAEMGEQLRSAIPDGSGSKGVYLTEFSEDARLYCFEAPAEYEPTIANATNASGAGHTTFCLRIDADAKRDHVVAVAIFSGIERGYRALGGARVAAEAARTAHGFWPR
jgi:hypothetical protein